MRNGFKYRIRVIFACYCPKVQSLAQSDDFITWADLHKYKLQQWAFQLFGGNTMANYFKRSLGVLLAASSFHVGATTVTISDNEWHAFDVDDLTSNSTGVEWIDIIDGSALNFSFTLTSDAILRVVDGGGSGERFQVNSNGSPLGVTSAAVVNTSVAPLPPTQAAFDAAWADANFSKASYQLTAGTYSITGLLSPSDSLLTSTVGAVMLAPVPEPTNAILLLAGLGVIAARIRARRVV